MTKALQLIITCDDGGLSSGVDDAVIDLYQQGMVSAVSVMSNMPTARHALKRFAAFPDLEIGAHLNLTEGSPLSDAMRQSSMVYQDVYKGRLQCFLQGLFLTNAMQTIVSDELEAQMQVFIAENIQPAHITTHHHFHMLPPMRRIVYALARKYNVRWVRNSHLRGASIPSNPFVQHKATNSHKSKQNLIEPNYVVLVQEWQKQPPQALLSELRQLNGLIEMVIHPCTAVDETFPETVLYQAHERYQEVQFIQALWMMSRGEIEVIKATQT